MKIIWDLNEQDIKKLNDFISTQQNDFVETRKSRNILKKDIQINRDEIIQAMLQCLLLSNQETGADKKITGFFNEIPIILQYQFLSKEAAIEKTVIEMLKGNGLTGYVQKVPGFFSFNFSWLEQSGWEIETQLKKSIETNLAKEEERELADGIDQQFKGFGSKQARNFLQLLGITKYEIPIGSRVIQWMKDFGFPLSFSLTALQDKAIYHFISDGIQLLCEKAGVYPCMLEAAITSGYYEINSSKKMNIPS